MLCVCFFCVQMGEGVVGVHGLTLILTLFALVAPLPISLRALFSSIFCLCFSCMPLVSNLLYSKHYFLSFSTILFLSDIFQFACVCVCSVCGDACKCSFNCFMLVYGWVYLFVKIIYLFSCILIRIRFVGQVCLTIIHYYYYMNARR
jgi:hypothetical protein